MLIYLADDERAILEDEMSIIQKLVPDAAIRGFSCGEDLLAEAEKKPCEIAFLDIQMAGISGTETARRLRLLTPDVNIIFCTAYDSYYRQAMELHASGYLLKPILEEDVMKELKDLRYGRISRADDKILKVYCFGNFDVRLPGGDPVRFKRSRAKEAFAFLVDHKGRPCTLREIAAALFEDEPFDKKNQQYIQKIISSMMMTLREYNLENVVEKSFNSMSVKVDLIDCDYYQWIEEKPERISQIPDNYMEQYPWAY